MNRNYFFKIFLCLLLILSNQIVWAQKDTKSTGKNEAAEEYLKRITAMADSIKQNRQTNKSTKTNSTPATRYTSSKYSTSKTTIDNAYNFLTAAEKEKVKNYPEVPEAFRTSEDAQAFVTKMKGLDVRADIQQFSKIKSMALVGFCVSYQSIQNKAELIIKEADKLKADFNKANPSINFGATVGKTYISENGLVYLPLGDASFIDEVVEANYKAGNIQFPKENCIGTPDYVLMKKLQDNKGIYSLGTNGTLTIKFVNNALVDVNGPDLYVFEAGEIEPTNLDISKNGIDWINVGKISGGTAAVDISKVAKPGDYFYYVRLTDLNTQSTVAGADIDAVAAIGAAMKLSPAAEVLFDLGKATLKAEGISAVKNLAVQLSEMSAAQINIDGFTDDIGSDETNQKLSQQRAEAVATILKEQLKSKSGFRFVAIGKGKSNPVVPNNNEENRKKNRRVEIIVSAK